MNIHYTLYIYMKKIEYDPRGQDTYLEHLINFFFFCMEQTNKMKMIYYYYYLDKKL